MRYLRARKVYKKPADQSKIESKLADLLMILMTVGGENRHYTTIMNILKLFKSLNGTHKGAFNFCINCLNGFCKAS